MGTHPIFESDFDCLTELRSKSGSINRGMNRAFGRLLSRRLSGTTDSAGAYLEQPFMRLTAPLRMFLFVLPVGYAGTLISKHGAAFLEEYDLFVPDDDDDDD